MGCDNTPVSGDKGTVQFDPAATITDYPEIDMFGYMKTRAKSDKDMSGADTRSAAVRLSIVKFPHFFTQRFKRFLNCH